MLFRFGAIFLLGFAVYRRQIAFAALAVLLLLFDLYIGYRVGVVIGILSAVTIVLNARGQQSLLIAERRSLIAGILFVAVIFIYKRVYTVVKLGLWDVVVDRMSDPQVLMLALMTSEPFGTQTILNEIIRTDFHTGVAYLGSLSSLLVPFSNLLGAEVISFNSLFQQKLFGGVVIGGMAANIWAQAYAAASWVGVGIAVCGYVTLLGMGSYLLSSARGALVILVAVGFTYVAFYIHRNDLLFMLVLLRRALIVWFLVVLPTMLLVDSRRLSRHAASTVRNT